MLHVPRYCYNVDYEIQRIWCYVICRDKLDIQNKNVLLVLFIVPFGIWCYYITHCHIWYGISYIEVIHIGCCICCIILVYKSCIRCIWFRELQIHLSCYSDILWQLLMSSLFRLTKEWCTYLWLAMASPLCSCFFLSSFSSTSGKWDCMKNKQ